jgi:hypothetical protein
LPLLFVGTTTLVAGVRALIDIYVPMAGQPATATIGRVCSVVTVVLVCSVLAIVGAAARRWAVLLRARADAPRAL